MLILCQLYGGKLTMKKCFDYDDENDAEVFLEECNDTLEDYR